MLFFSCKTAEVAVVSKVAPFQVPAYLSTSQLVSARYVNWYLDGEPVKAHLERGVLITSSGQHELMGAYFRNGEPDTVVVQFEAMPPNDFCQFAIETHKGSMVVSLSDLTPRHSDHFESLVERAYYDSLKFHRIVPGFVVQGGDGALRETRIDPRERTMKELNPEFNSELLHYKGALAMARMPDDVNPDKRSSPDQFYLVQGGSLDNERLEEVASKKSLRYKSYQRDRYLRNGGSPQLDMEYTVFGYVTHGFDIIDSLTTIPTNSDDSPVVPVYMKIKRVE